MSALIHALSLSVRQTIPHLSLVPAPARCIHAALPTRQMLRKLTHIYRPIRIVLGSVPLMSTLQEVTDIATPISIPHLALTIRPVLHNTPLIQLLRRARIVTRKLVY